MSVRSRRPPRRGSTARLDRLPMTRSLWIMAILLTFGGFFDGYAIGLIGALGPGLFKAQIFSADHGQLLRHDRLRQLRRGAVRRASSSPRCWCPISPIISAGAPSSPTRCCGSASPTSSWRLQTTADGVNFWRFISALGVGLELVTVDAYLSELVPKKTRGAAFAFLQAMSAIAFLVTYFLSWQLTPTTLFGYDGWRWVAWIGSVGAVVIWWIRLGLPESPRWLAQQGRHGRSRAGDGDASKRGSRPTLGRPLPAAGAAALPGSAAGAALGDLQPALPQAHHHADAVQLLPDGRASMASSPGRRPC